MFLERDGRRGELIPRVAFSDNSLMLAKAIACALVIPVEAVMGLDSDQRRILSHLILNSDGLSSVCDIAYTLSGSFRGVEQPYVVAKVESLRQYLAEQRLPFRIDGSPEAGFRLGT